MKSEMDDQGIHYLLAMCKGISSPTQTRPTRFVLVYPNRRIGKPSSAALLKRTETSAVTHSQLKFGREMVGADATRTAHVLALRPRTRLAASVRAGLHPLLGRQLLRRHRWPDSPSMHADLLPPPSMGRSAFRDGINAMCLPISVASINASLDHSFLRTRGRARQSTVHLINRYRGSSYVTITSQFFKIK
jgi:hypothetical protein